MHFQSEGFALCLQAEVCTVPAYQARLAAYLCYVRVRLGKQPSGHYAVDKHCVPNTICTSASDMYTHLL